MQQTANKLSTTRGPRQGFHRAFRRTFRGTALIWSVLASGIAYAGALEAAPDEWDKLQACERNVCKMILAKKAGANIDCKVTKTWDNKKKATKAADTSGVPTDQALKGEEATPVKWGFGDAQCTAELKLSAADLQSALVEQKHTINIAPHTVKCMVDRYGELKPVTATLAPRLDFKDGKAQKVWINLKDIDGPSDIKSFIKTTAKLEDSIGLFHGPMIKSINKWMYKKCGEKYGPEAEAKAQKELASKTAAEQKKKAAAANAPASVAPKASTETAP
jgi:hypothetical protein